MVNINFYFEVMKEPVVVVINGTKPGADIQINNTSPTAPRVQVSFSITIRRLVERSSDGAEISSVSLQDSDLIFDIHTSTFANSRNLRHDYSAELSNNAIVNITVSQIIFILFCIIIILYSTKILYFFDIMYSFGNSKTASQSSVSTQKISHLQPIL